MFLLQTSVNPSQHQSEYFSFPGLHVVWPVELSTNLHEEGAQCLEKGNWQNPMTLAQEMGEIVQKIASMT